jgi:hypothetical protein
MTSNPRSPRVWLALRAGLPVILVSTWLLPSPALAQLPSLPGELVVTITSPASGATIAGTTTVSASVSPAGILVVGVQFTLDGAHLGAEDTSAPYAVLWDTASASNGSHSLTAIARDALGIRFISEPVRVMVANAPPPPPPDSTPPTVTIASPASGATVAGTITVNAAADDDVEVARVRFTLDGGDLGAEDATAPYTVDWDTTTVSDGSHTLTAVARDAAGNQATSGPVTVTVSNAPPPPPPPPPPGTGERIEETDPSVTFSGDWAQGNADREWSGGTAAVSTTGGARATLAFTGSSVTWIGFRGPQTGIARVFLDGGFVTEVDTYSASEEVQAVLFTVTDLADADHSLAIEVVGLQNPASSGSFIVVDAFEAGGGSGDPGDTPAATRIEETDPSVTFSGTWFENPRPDHSGGTAQKSSTSASRASFTFSGTGVRVIGFRTTVCGVARVFLDGALAAEVDTYAPADEAEAVIFEARGLPRGDHSLVIEVTGTYNPPSAAAWVAVDAFDVIP